MPVTEEQVRAQLEKEEPDYTAAAQLGPDALPVLEKLVRGPDPLLASKAAYLASMIPDRRAAKVLEAAAQSPHATVRVAAAAGLKEMPAVAEHVIISLVDDRDEGVRKVALKSVRGKLTPAVRGHLEEKAARERNPSMRAAFHAALETPVAGSAAQAHAPEAQSGAPGEGGGDPGTGATISITGEPGRESGGGGDRAPSPAVGGTGGGDGGGTTGSAAAVEVSSHGGGRF